MHSSIPTQSPHALIARPLFTWAYTCAQHTRPVLGLPTLRHPASGVTSSSTSAGKVRGKGLGGDTSPSGGA